MANRLLLNATTAVVTTLGALVLPLAAFAQDTAQDTQPGSAALEEIVVTAERFRSTVQTTPVAVTAFNPAILAERQVTNVQQAAQQIPGIVITPATGNSAAARIVLRGAGQEQSGILFDPAVGIYIDGVYQPRINGAFFDLFDVAGLEVLRGPQGTLYGRNSSGGALKITTLRPTNYVSFGGDVAVGNYASQDVRGYISAPLIKDQLAFSLSGVSRKRDGMIYAPAYGRDVNNRDSSTVRGKLLWTPTARFEAEASYAYTRDESEPGLGVPLQVGVGVIDARATGRDRDLSVSELFGPFGQSLSNNAASLNMSYEISSELKLNAITGYGHLRQTNQGPLWLTVAAQTSGNGALNAGTSNKLDDKFWSQEVNLTLDTERLKGVVGLYYFDEDGDYQQIPPYSTPAIWTRRTKASAVFAQGTYTLFGGFGVTAGIRATKEEANMSQFFYTLLPNVQRASKDFTGTTPKFGLSWQVNPNTLLYASYTKGFKSGGFNAVPPNANTGVGGAIGAPTPYGQEEVDSYEAGFKFQTPDRRFRLNAAIFEARYNGLQLPVFFPGTSTSYTSNASDATIRGIELEPTWQVFDILQLYGNLSFSEGKYTSPFNCALFNNSIVNCQDRKIKGLIPQKVVLGFALTPELPIPGSVRIIGQWDHQAKYFNNVSNGLDLIQTPERDLFDASVAWTSPDEHWVVSLEGRNLTDERYVLAGLQLSSATRASVTGYPGEFRTYALRVRANFDRPPEPVAPPPPPAPAGSSPPPPPPPAPVAYEAREFVVYFPFDQYVLTPEAQQVISQAADYAKGGNATRVVVVGHADTSGSAAYNVRLSERRAKATADALVGSGLAQTALAVDWKGESQPAVATADGVKEPLNRRATININF